MLQVVEGSAVGDGGHQSAQLQRRHGNALAEAAHAAHAALGCGYRLIRIDAQLLARDVVAGQLAEAELRGVVANAVEAEFAAQFLKVEVVAMGQCLGHVHAEAGQLHRGVAGDQALRERRQGHGKLDGGAGLGARRERQLLVDHGQDAPVGGVDDHGGAVHVAQGVDGRLADHRVFAGGDVAGKNVAAGKGTGREALIVAMAADMKRSPAQRARGAPGGVHVMMDPRRSGAGMSGGRAMSRGVAASGVAGRGQVLGCRPRMVQCMWSIKCDRAWCAGAHSNQSQEN